MKLDSVLLWILLTQETNRYAARLIQKKSDSKWYNTIIAEMKQFIGINIAMSILELPSYKMYWSRDWLFSVPAFQSLMLRSRFEKLLQYFHAAPSCAHARGTDGYGPLHQIRPLITAPGANHRQGYDSLQRSTKF